MSVDNQTPFPALAFRQYNLAGGLFGVVVFGIASATGVFAVVWPDAVFTGLCFAMIGGLVARRRLGPAISWGAARTR